MNITSTAVTTTANETTKQGYYELEYSVQDNKLSRLQATLFAPSSEQNPERLHIGYIVIENDTMHCSLPSDVSYAPIFTDFDQFVTTIKTSLTTKK